MYQKEIEFFWPLTEQISLDLDYSNAGKPFVTSLDKTDCIISSASNISWTAANTITTAQLTVTASGIETPEITFTLNKKPFIIKRMMYNLLGIKWKIK